MADYSQPYMPNVYSNALALQTMQGIQDKQNQYNANLQAADAISGGDYDAAERVYRAAGMNQEADQAKAKGLSIQAGGLISKGDYHGAADLMMRGGFYDQARKFNEDHLNDVNKLYGIGANIAQVANPDQWKTFLDRARGDGFDVSQFEDPATGPKLMQAWAGKFDDFRKARLDQLKTFPPRPATMKGEDGRDIAGLAIYDADSGKYHFTPGEPGLSITGDAINAKPGSGKTVGGLTPDDIINDIAAKYPDKPRVSRTFAAAVSNVLGSKFNAGLSLDSVDFNERGEPTMPHFTAAKGTAAELRANQWDTDAQFARSRAQRSGIKQADADQRASFIVGALNHLGLAREHLQEPGMNDVIGAVHGGAGFQKWRGSMFPADVQTPENYGKLRQDLESAQAEIERVYTAGQGVVTDAEREALKGIIVAIKDAPNVETAMGLVDNARELIGGILATPTIQDVARDKTLGKARDIGLTRVDDLIAKSKHLAPDLKAPPSEELRSGKWTAPMGVADGVEIEHDGKTYVKRGGKWMEK